MGDFDEELAKVRKVDPLDAKIRKYAQDSNLDDEIIRRMIGQESGGDKQATSWANNKGRLQVSDAVVKRFVKPEEFGSLDPYNDDVNLAAGTRYYRWLLDRYKGDHRRALAGYNAGEGNADAPDWEEKSKYWSNDKAVQSGQKPRGPSDPTNTYNYVSKITAGYSGNGTRVSNQIDTFGVELAKIRSPKLDQPFPVKNQQTNGQIIINAPLSETPKEDKRTEKDLRSFVESNGFTVNRTFGKKINEKSLHPFGLAADVKIQGKSQAEIEGIIQKALENGYRVVDEREPIKGIKQTGPHLHLEINPNKPSTFQPDSYYSPDALDRIKKLDGARFSTIKLPPTNPQNAKNPIDDTFGAELAKIRQTKQVETNPVTTGEYLTDSQSNKKFFRSNDQTGLKPNQIRYESEGEKPRVFEKQADGQFKPVEITEKPQATDADYLQYIKEFPRFAKKGEKPMSREQFFASVKTADSENFGKDAELKYGINPIQQKSQNQANPVKQFKEQSQTQFETEKDEDGNIKRVFLQKADKNKVGITLEADDEPPSKIGEATRKNITRSFQGTFTFTAQKPTNRNLTVDEAVAETYNSLPENVRGAFEAYKQITGLPWFTPSAATRSNIESQIASKGMATIRYPISGAAAGLIAAYNRNAYQGVADLLSGKATADALESGATEYYNTKNPLMSRTSDSVPFGERERIAKEMRQKMEDEDTSFWGTTKEVLGDFAAGAVDAISPRKTLEDFGILEKRAKPSGVTEEIFKQQEREQKINALEQQYGSLYNYDRQMKNWDTFSTFEKAARYWQYAGNKFVGGWVDSLKSVPILYKFLTTFGGYRASSPVEENEIYKSLELFKKQYTTNDQYIEGSASGELTAGLASAIQFMSGGAVFRGSKLATALLGISNQIPSMYEDMRRRGIKPEDALFWSTIAGIPLGASEIVGIGGESARLFNAAALGAQLKRGSLKTLLEFTKTVGKDIAKEGLEEFFQEGFQTAAGNAVIETLARDDLHGVKRLLEFTYQLPIQTKKAVPQALMAGATGAIFGGATSSIVEAGMKYDDSNFKQRRDLLSLSKSKFNFENININGEITKTPESVKPILEQAGEKTKEAYKFWYDAQMKMKAAESAKGFNARKALVIEAKDLMTKGTQAYTEAENLGIKAQEETTRLQKDGAVPKADFADELAKVQAQSNTSASNLFHKDFGFVKESPDQTKAGDGEVNIDILEGARKGESVNVQKSELTGGASTSAAQGLSFGDEVQTSKASEKPETKFTPGTKVFTKDRGEGQIIEERENGKFVVDFNPKTDKDGNTVYTSRAIIPNRHLSTEAFPDTNEAKKSATAKLAQFNFGVGDRVEVPLGDSGATQRGELKLSPNGEIVFNNRVLTDDELGKTKLVEAAAKGSTGSVLGNTENISQPKPEPKKASNVNSQIVDYTPDNKSKNQKLFTERNTEIEVTPTVVDDKDILTSFDEGFPAELQPRDRSRLASELQIGDIAKNLNPNRLGDTFDAGQGRPILVPVTVNGETKYAALTGNGRITAVRRNYDRQNAKADEYRLFTLQKGGDGKMERPVYAAILNNASAVNLEDFVGEANEGTSQLSAVEQAVQDARKLDDNLLSFLKVESDGKLDTSENEKFYQKFFARTVEPNQRGRFMKQDGGLSSEGVIRMRNAIFAKAFGDSPEGMNALAKIAEDTDLNVRNIANGLVRVSGIIAKFKEAAAAGLRHPSLDIAANISNALEKYSFLREKKVSVETFVNQRALPGQTEMPPIEKMLLLTFEEFKKSSKAIGQIFENYYSGADEAGDPNQISMFGTNETPLPSDLLQAAVETYEEGSYAAIKQNSQLFANDVQAEQPETGREVPGGDSQEQPRAAAEDQTDDGRVAQDEGRLLDKEPTAESKDDIVSEEPDDLFADEKTDETTDKPFGDNLAPRDLFQNPLTPKTEQTGLFNVRQITNDAETAKRDKNLETFGEETGSILHRYAELPKANFPLTSRTAQTVLNLRPQVEEKAQAGQDFIADVARALDKIQYAESVDTPFDEYLRQPSMFDNTELSERERVIYDIIAAGRFDSWFPNTLNALKATDEFIDEVNDNDESAAGNLEPDSEAIPDANPIRQDDVFAESEPTPNSFSDGDEGTGETKDLAGSVAEYFGDNSLFGGTQSDSDVRLETSEPVRSDAGNSERTGSDQISEVGRTDTNAGRGSESESLFPESEVSQNSLKSKKEQQRRAESIEVITGNRANIDETLPFLMPEQRDDVMFVERGFFELNNQGSMLTNGTGTGKTYSGLGVIKRFARRGNENILVVAPSQEIINAWAQAAPNMNLQITQLRDTADNGTRGIVATTYANLSQNPELLKRKWDLVVGDEAHTFSANAEGNLTGSAEALRAITLHKRGRYNYGTLAAIKEIRQLADIERQIEELTATRENLINSSIVQNNDRAIRQIDVELEPLARIRDELRADIQRIRDEAQSEFDRRRQDENPTPVLFLSATPFAYQKSIEYAEGYLYDYDENMPPGDRVRSYNEPDNREAFFIQHFGYRMRYNKLTEPDARVDRSVMERQFNTWLKQRGVLSGRLLAVEADYSRNFVLVQNAVGSKIDEGLNFLRDGANRKYAPLYDIINSQFSYHNRQFLLEAIKAKESIEIIKKQIALGRKVVVFHGFNTGGGFHPFIADVPNMIQTVMTDRKPTDINLRELYEEFVAERPDLVNLNLNDLFSPIETFRRAFDGSVRANGITAMFVNGRETKRTNQSNINLFQTDNSNANLIVVQQDKGQAGISLHDTTGTHQRVEMNLGLPVKPVAAIQMEGRIYRVGSVTDAIQLYFNTGTMWERIAFAQTIAQRASTAENLALGEEARALRQSFIDAFNDPIEGYEPGYDGEGKGGKEADKAAASALTDWQRAISYYFGQQKKTSKNKAQEGVDYYPTPEPIGLKMVEWANSKEFESMLEPSAGHGAIARFFPENTRNTFVEPSPDLSSRLMMVTDGTTARYAAENFEVHHIVNKYDTVVMNPPYGTGGKTAIDHLAKAAQHLRNGGRIVALLPDLPAADKRFDAWYESDEAKNMVKVGEVGLPNVTFERAGTKVKTRIVILDKQNDRADMEKMPSERKIDLSNAATVNELFDRLENLEMPPRVVPANSVNFARPTNPNAPVTALPGEESDAQTGGRNSENFFSDFESQHTQTGDMIYIAVPKQTFSEDDYRNYLNIARRFGGFWNKFGQKYGSRKGFRFTSPENRQAFYNAINKDSDVDLMSVADQSPIAEETLNQKEEQKKQAFALVKTLPLPSLTPTAEVTRAGANVCGNIQTQEILRRALEQIDINRGRLSPGEKSSRPSLEGLFLEPGTVREVIGNLRESYNQGKAKGYPEKEIGILNKIADELDEAAKIGGKTAVFYTTDEKLPQEIYHQASYLGAIEKALTNRYAKPQMLDEHEAVLTADKNFFSKFAAYSVESIMKQKGISRFAAQSLRNAIVREETAAWIAEGSWEKLGLDYDTAMDYLLTALEQYAEKNYVVGNETALEKFKEAGKYVYEAIQKIEETLGDPKPDPRAEAKAKQSAARQTAGNNGKPETGRPAGASQENDSGQKRFGSDGQKLASLPGTERNAGIGINDVTYDVFGDKAAISEAQRLIEDNGIEGTIKLLGQIESPDVHHAIASFSIQKQLLDEAERIADAQPKKAKELQEIAQQLGANHALAAVKAGRFNRAASIIQQSVATVIEAARKIYADKAGRGKLLPDKIFERISAIGKKGESAVAETESHSKAIELLKREIANLKKILSGDEKMRKTSKATVAKRRKLVSEIKREHQTEFESAMARLKNRAFLKSRENSGVDVMSIFDDALYSAVEDESEPKMPEDLLEDFATAGAMKLTEGLATPESMFPSGFDAEMLAEFGSEIEPFIRQIHKAAFEKRDEWLKEIARDKKVKEVRAEFGENLTDDEVDEILNERSEEFERHKAIEQLHKIRAKNGNLRQLDRLEEIISELAKKEDVAVAAAMLAREPMGANRFYETLSEMGYAGRDARDILREAEVVLKQAQEQMRKESDDLQAKIGEKEKEVESYENMRDAARRRLKESQMLISKELRRIADGDFKYYLKEYGLGLLDSFRGLMVAGEIGFVMRQGNWFSIVNLTKRNVQREEWANLVKGLSEKSFDRVIQEMERDEDYPLAVKAGLQFAGLGRFDEQSLTKGEEDFRHNLFEKIPGLKQTIGKYIEKSETTMIGFLDTQRLNIFKAYVAVLKANGQTFEDNPQEFRAIANYINSATGRSVVKSEKITNMLMNLPLFAARFYASRIKHLALTTVGWAFLPKHARMIVLKDMGRYYAATGGVLFLAHLLGLVSLDWDDADFLKIKLGSRRIDILGGMQQWIRFFAQTLTTAGREVLGEKYSAGIFRDNVVGHDEKGNTTVRELDHDWSTKGYLGRFVRTKLNPVVSLAVDYKTGEDFLGNPFSWDKAIATRALPIFLQNVYQNITRDGALGATASSSADFIGIGYQNYDDPPEEAQTPAEKLAKKINQMRMPDRTEDAAERQLYGQIAQLKARARKGENVTPEVTGLFQSGLITKKRALSILRGADDSYLESKVSHMPTDLVRQVRKQANPSEAEQLDDIIKIREINKMKRKGK